MVVVLALRVRKVVHPCRVKIYCNSLAPGHGARLCTFPLTWVANGVLERLSPWLRYHLTYCNLLDVWLRAHRMLCLLLSITWSNIDAFYAKLITYTNPCYLTKCILLESRVIIYPYVDKSCGVPFVLMMLPTSWLQVRRSRSPSLGTSLPRTEVRGGSRWPWLRKGTIGI
jgi:hypothetical protein